MKEILIPLNITTTAAVYDTKQSFSSSDEASGVLTFTTTADVAGTVASLTIRNASENANRQTVLIERLDVNSSPFSYTFRNPLPFGQYEGTVLLKKNLTVIASVTFLFGVNSSLSAEVLPDLVKAYSLDELVENVETEISYLKDAFNLTVSETVKGVNKTESRFQAQENVRYLNEHTRKTNEESRIANEQARIAAELLRKDTFDTLVDSAVIEQTVVQEVANEFQQIQATYANRLLSTEQQLAEAATELGDILNSDKVSKQVALSDTDVTTTLTTALADFKSRGLKYAYFDTDTAIQLNTALEQKDVLFIGKSEIGKRLNHNVFYNINDSLKTFDGDVNKNYCKFTQLKSAIAATRPINFTIWGDSISTNGDLTNVNTASVAGTTESGPDTLNEGDTYTSFLYDLVGDSMKDKTLNFYNRSIGGTYMGEWNALKTINTVEKTWIEHIKDTAPDVLIIAFGMNHSTLDRARATAYNIKQITDYINANFVNKPDLVFVTGPRPTYQPQSYWGNYEEQSSREITASAIRNAAQKYKAYLMDVNRLSNLKRVGIDWLNPTFKDFDPSPYITKAKTGDNYVFDANGQNMPISCLMRDFVMKFTVTFAGQAVTGDYMNIVYNKTKATGFNGNQININPKITDLDQTQVRSYAKISDYLNWTASPSVNKIFSPAETVMHLRIEKRGNKLEILREAFNGVPLGYILRDELDVWDGIGDFLITHNQVTAGFTSTISNFKMYAPIYEECLPEVTESMMWGAFDPLNTDPKMPYGGNGVNHPSSIGIRKVYLPTVEKFAQAIADVYRNS